MRFKQMSPSMGMLRGTVLPLLLATVWISLSEFIRNDVLFPEYWRDHYSTLGLTFPSEPVNGMIWGLWSLLFAIGLFILLRRFTLRETVLLGWFLGFVLMWVVTGNLGVLPFQILWFAVPLSLLEVGVAVWILWRMRQKQQ